MNSTVSPDMRWLPMMLSQDEMKRSANHRQVGGPVGKVAKSATAGVGKTVSGVTTGLGQTVGDTTSGIGNYDISKTVGGATGGVGECIGSKAARMNYMLTPQRQNRRWSRSRT